MALLRAWHMQAVGKDIDSRATLHMLGALHTGLEGKLTAEQHNILGLPSRTPEETVTVIEAIRAEMSSIGRWLADRHKFAYPHELEDVVRRVWNEHKEALTSLDTICGDPPPRGVFYLVERDHHLAGMGGVRWNSHGVAEIKRLYVRPAHRRAKLGATILRRLLADARAFGYERVKLDTAPFMHAAHMLYESAGFHDCAPYQESEVPAFLHVKWRFMEKVLDIHQRWSEEAY
jgi:GNAT superfamily N-acetyltransferase